MIRVCLLACLGLWSPSLASAQQSEVRQDVDALVDRYMQEYEVPGFVISILEKDKTVYQQSYGVGNVHTMQAVSSNSLFHMASVTKTFVGTALMQLQEHGRMDLNRPIVHYLPYFVLGDERYDQITVGQAASHISGMKDFDSNPWHDVSYDEGALERFVRDFVSLKYLDRDPGVAYEYCNTLYEVLGDVIAKASGMSFEDYVHENILQPLSMDGSTLLFREVDKARLTAPHFRRDNEVVISDVYPYNRMHGPSSTLVSSAEDMSRYVRMYLNRGELDGERILQASTVDAMWAPAAGRFENIGTSWHRREHRGETLIYHGGSDVGYKSFVMIFPGRSIGAVFMSNSTAIQYDDFSAELADILLAHVPPHTRRLTPLNR